MSLALDRSLLEGLKQFSPRAKGFQVSRRFHGFVVGPPGSSETLHPGEKCGIQEISGQIQGIWRDVVESLRLALDRLFLCFWGSFNQGTWFGAWPPPPAEDKHQAQQYITTFHSFTEHVWTCRIFMDLYGSSRIFQPCPFASCLQARCWKTLQRHMHCHNLLRKDSQITHWLITRH